MDNVSFMSVSSAARLIGKSESQVRYAAATGKLPVIRTENGQRLFKRSDVEAFVRKSNEKPSPEAA